MRAEPLDHAAGVDARWIMTDKQFYRPDELACAIDVSISTVRRWIKRGLVMHVHMVRGIRIPTEEYTRILSQGVAPPANSPGSTIGKE